MMSTFRARTTRTVCSSLAIATALVAMPQGTHAQSFQGSSTVVAGSANVTTGANSTTVDVASAQAVINWTPFDTATNPGVPIVFQPAGTTATFQSTSDFAVLNRILPTDASRPIIFDGNVISQIQSAVTSPGGTVYFYSPGGVIVGSNAVFNVGNLGLTTSDPLVSGGNFIGTSGSGNPQVAFTGAASGSSVEIQPGAQINALNTGSYVAAFAPAVFQKGLVTVNGQAAYVGGEAGTITFNPNGLFDIQVTTGTDGVAGGLAIQHDGTTTGGASQGAGDSRRIYLVAVPKNQLITLAVARGSSLGFDIAGAADVIGNAVILSAGHNISGGAIEAAPSGGTGRADLAINDSDTLATGTGIDFTSAVTAQASRNLRLDVFRQTNFASDVSLTGLEISDVAVNTLPAETPGQLVVGGDLTISAQRQVALPGSPGDAGSSRMFVVDGANADISGNLSILANAFAFSTADGATTGGEALLSVTTGGGIDVGGDLRVSAQGLTETSPSPMNATGGDAQVIIDGGNATVVGATRIRSEGVGRGANATGGFSALSIQANSGFVTGELNVSADADLVSGGPTATTGVATGGFAIINMQGPNSTLTVLNGNTGNVNIGEGELISAEAFGGEVNAVGGTGGAAVGGTAIFNVVGGAVANLPIDPGPIGQTRIWARSWGGAVLADGGTGGSATGGTVSLVIDGGTLNSGNLLLPSSFALGGSAGPGVTGAANGGNAIGGVRNIAILNGGVLNGGFAGGGPGAQGGDGSATGVGGNGTGGASGFVMDNGTINAATDAFGPARITAFAQNAGGKGMIGGNASGGQVDVTIRNGSVINASGAGSVINFGSNNQTPDATVAGVVSTGDAAAGNTHVTIENSAITAEQFIVYSDATSGSFSGSIAAGANARTGNATSGIASLDLNAASITANAIFVEAAALAGGSNATTAVNGGTATAGNAQIAVHDAASTITGTLTLNASAGGNSISGGPGNGGASFGGFAHINAFNGGSLTVIGDTVIDAGAAGQSALVLGAGGNATAGFTEATANGGSATFNGNLEINSTASGGSGQTGGQASGAVETDRPNAFILARNGTLTVTGDSQVIAESFGGQGLIGGAGGGATGGFALVDAQNDLGGASAISLQTLTVSSDAIGGSGGTGVSESAGGAGGAAQGGNTQVFGDAGNGALIVASQATLTAEAIGGSGGQGGGGVNGGAGGTGGAAQAGGIQFGTRSGLDTGSLNAGSASFTDLFAFANASGGLGGDGGVGTSTTGNGGNGGAANSGRTVLLVRGSPVTITGSVFMTADAVGGDGGSGAIVGNGGAATVGAGGTGVAVAVTSRFQQPTQRGFLDAQDIFGSTQAFGGDGTIVGAASVVDSAVQFEVSGADVSANSLGLLASGDTATGTLPSYVSVANGTVDIAGSLSIETPGNLYVTLDNSTVNVGDLFLSAGNFVAAPTQPTARGTFNVAGTFDISSTLDFLAYANFNVAGGGLFDADGSVSTGDLTFGGTLDLSAVGSITTGTVNAGLVSLNAGQNLATAAITSDNGIFLVSGGTTSIGNLSSGGTTPGAGKIAIASSGPLNAGTMQSTGDLGIQSAGSITTGNLVGRDVVLLSGGNLSTGSISALNGTQTTGQIYLGSVAMASSSANVFQPFQTAGGLLSLLPADPVALNGSATFSGPLQGGAVRGAVTGALSAQAIDAQSLLSLSAGGLASIGGAWRAPDIEIVSGDIAIGSAGSLDALSVNGVIELASTNAAGVTVGDGQSGSGYALDNAEFGRVKAGEIGVVGLDTQQATDMTIGNLTITGNQLYGAGGSVFFATGDRLTQTPGGIVRVAGALNATGFAATNELGLLAGTVEIEAANGSLKVSDGSGSLGGLVTIDAAHIHVATDAILAKLRADPAYAGHITELNTPSLVTRPDGVLNALGIEFFPGETLYIQNTGAAGTPAGFLTTLDNTDVVPPATLPANGIEVVINGQFQTATGPVSGRDASDLVQGLKTTDPTVFDGFSDTSQLNGCVFLTNVCTTIIASDPVAAVSSEITMLTGTTLDDAPRAPAALDADEGGDEASESEDRQDEEDAEDAGDSPIAPPAPLINTRQLNPDLDVADPVSGAGNPALLGSAVDETIAEGESE